ncbi:MAG: iron chaperone [Gemmatimonadaceae bacterium]
MIDHEATTVDSYLAALPPERRDVVGTVRDTILRHLPVGYEEAMGFGMINYVVPLARFPDTYNGAPLCYAGLAAQKSHYSLYLMGAYGSASETRSLRDAFARAGKKLDMGKSCVRFRSLEDLPLDVIGQFIARTPADAYVAAHTQARTKAKATPRKGAARKSVKTTKRSRAAKRTTRKAVKKRAR